MHKAGFVNIVGNPNVGKSTLMNQLVGERISIATFKAQTTRHRIMGIVMKWHSLLPNAEILPISAKNKFGVDMLLKRIKELLPESPAYFDKDQLTDKPARFFVSEIIREKILLYYDKEIP